MRWARVQWGAPVVGWVFAHASFLLPVKRYYESPTLLVFQHPTPSYSTHLVFTPKKRITGVHSLTTVDGNTLIEIVQVAAQLSQKLNLKQAQLVVNAGAYQTVPQLHFHLITRAD